MSSYGKCMGFPANFPQYGKMQQNSWNGESDTHTFPIVWVLFSHPIPILCDTSAYGKCMGFPINFPQYDKIRKCNRTHGVGKVWEIDTHTFPIVWVLISH